MNRECKCWLFPAPLLALAVSLCGCGNAGGEGSPGSGLRSGSGLPELRGGERKWEPLKEPGARSHAEARGKAASGGKGALAPPVWGISEKVRAWTLKVKEVVSNRFRDFDSARDAEFFCPGYRKASREEKENCWLILVSAVSKFESRFKAGTSFREDSGVDSIGLLALSPGECPNAPKAEDLMDPVKNLECGTRKMATLIAREGVVDGPGYTGASRYWSALRPRHKRYNKTRKRELTLGFKAEIADYTSRYNERGWKNDGPKKEVLWVVGGGAGRRLGAWIPEVVYAASAAD